MSPAARRRAGQKLHPTVAIAASALLISACSTAISTNPNATPDRPQVGIILGGGGESGVAWQTGVLAALGNQARLTPAIVDVVVGTSAGAISGMYFSQGLDMNKLVENERAGKGLSAPVKGGSGGHIPMDVLAALNSPGSSIEERGRKAGALAMKVPVGISSADFIGYIDSSLPDKKWPALDFRPTAVNAATGQTILWKKTDDIPLAAAVASSVAVPGFLPVVEINGRPYVDAPRTSFSDGLAKEKGLNAFIYIGMPTPDSSNVTEENTLAKLEAEGLKVARITGGAGSEELIRNALDPKVRPFAVEVGLRDGAAAADSVSKLLRS